MNKKEVQNLCFSLGESGRPVLEITHDGQAFLNGQKCDNDATVGSFVRKLIMVQNGPKSRFVNRITNDFVEYVMPKSEYVLEDFINSGLYVEVEVEDIVIEQVSQSQNGIITQEPRRMPAARIVGHFKRA